MSNVVAVVILRIMQAQKLQWYKAQPSTSTITIKLETLVLIGTSLLWLLFHLLCYAAGNSLFNAIHCSNGIVTHRGNRKDDR